LKEPVAGPEAGKKGVASISTGLHLLLKCVQTLDLLPITPETIAARAQVIPAETIDYPTPMSVIWD